MGRSFSMFKYTAEDRLKAVERYLKGRESANEIAKSLEIIKQWYGSFYSTIYKLYTYI